MNSFLEAREARQAALSRSLGDGSEHHRALVFLSLNVAGRDKTPRGAMALFSWALRELLARCPPFSAIEVSQDALGHYAIVGCGRDPLDVKRIAVGLEAAHPVARLVDVDVYDACGTQIGRRDIGLPARACLLCDEAAVDCIRLKRHLPEDVVAKTHELLTNFCA